MAFSPEDRLEQAAIPQMKIFENVALNNFKSSNFFNNGLMNEKKIKEHSQKILSDFSVNTENVELKSQFLSGGNLQKLIIGRELITSPELLICFNPNELSTTILSMPFTNPVTLWMYAAAEYGLLVTV